MTLVERRGAAGILAQGAQERMLPERAARGIALSPAAWGERETGGEAPQAPPRRPPKTACYRGQSFVSPGWQAMLEQVPSVAVLV